MAGFPTHRPNRGMPVYGLTDGFTVDDLERKLLDSKDAYKFLPADLYNLAEATTSPEIAVILLENIPRLRERLFVRYLSGPKDDWLADLRRKNIEAMIKRLQRLVAPSLPSRAVSKIRDFFGKRISSTSNGESPDEQKRL